MIASCRYMSRPSRKSPHHDFDEAIRRYLGDLQRFVGMLTDWSDDCDDLISETITTAFEKWAKRPEDELILSWLFRIARNHVLNHERSKRTRFRRHSGALKDIARISDGGEFVDLQAHLLGEAFKELSDKEIQILTLFYWDRLPALTICRLLSISESQLYVRLHRARSHLLAVMGRLERLGGEHD